MAYKKTFLLIWTPWWLFFSCVTDQDPVSAYQQNNLRNLRELVASLKSDPHPYESYAWGEWWGVRVEGSRVRIKMPLTLRARFDSELYLWALSGPFHPEDKDNGDYPKLFSQDVFARIQLERTASSWTWEGMLPPGVYGHSTVDLAVGESNPLYQHDGPGMQNIFIVGLEGHEESAVQRLTTGDVFHQRHPVGWEKAWNAEAVIRIRNAQKEVPAGWQVYSPGRNLPSGGTFRNLFWKLEESLLSVEIPEKGWEKGVFLRIFSLEDHKDFPSLEASLEEGRYPFYRPQLKPPQGTRTAQVTLPPGTYGITDHLSQENSEDFLASRGSVFLGSLRVKPGFRETGAWFSLGVEPSDPEMAWLIRAGE